MDGIERRPGPPDGGPAKDEPAKAEPVGLPDGGPKGLRQPRHARAATEAERRVIFNYCHLVLHARAGLMEPAVLRPAVSPTAAARLTRRMHETMKLMLTGDSEKQIADKLRISRHTVHVYVKQIYRRYNVNSKGELFADWVRRGGTLARHPEN